MSLATKNIRYAISSLTGNLLLVCRHCLESTAIQKEKIPELAAGINPEIRVLCLKCKRPLIEGTQEMDQFRGFLQIECQLSLPEIK